SHSKVTPTTSGPAPTANKISVVEGNNDTIRTPVNGSRCLMRASPDLVLQRSVEGASALGSRMHGSGLAPVDDEIAFGEVPPTLDLRERVEISQRRDHDPALVTFGEDVVRDRVALSRCAVAGERDRAL